MANNCLNFNPPVLWIRNYFSLADLISQTSLSFDTTSPFEVANQNITWQAIFEAYGLDSFADSEYITDLLQQYIYPRFWNRTLFYVDVEQTDATTEVEPTVEDIKAAAIPVVGRIWAWLNGSSEKFELLIGLYKTQETKLLDQLSSVATTLFNDTPQNAGDFTTDNHTTNATKVATSTDVGTPMSRLKEIQDHLEHLYSDWSDQFKTFVLYY